jgi:phenylalanyl-tRNA synthetase alpha chain
MQDLDAIVAEAIALFARIDDADQLEQAKARYVGRSGVLREAEKSLGKLAAAERPAFGSKLNAAKQRIETALGESRERIQAQKLEFRLKEEAIDVTLPGRGLGTGGLHPVNRTLQRIEQLFRTMGFTVVDGPEIETDYYNFTALNQPENHPARSMHDTFYLADGVHLLRTHTSPIQIRFMEQHRPPIRIIAPGRVYRVDSDATHSPVFHQIEGLWIDESISLADLKGVLIDFLKLFFERDDLQVRFRPSFFPFTEPSAEIDMSFGKGWLEMGGAGMVHPNVLRNVNIDRERYQGFAFGLGPDRLTMLRYGVNDLRLFFENDLRFLRQFD